MREYQIYFGTDAGVFGRRRSMWLASDEEAIDLARRVVEDGADVDIWQGDRRVVILQRPRALKGARALNPDFVDVIIDKSCARAV